jgi:hypothetical protein
MYATKLEHLRKFEIEDVISLDRVPIYGLFFYSTADIYILLSPRNKKMFALKKRQKMSGKKFAVIPDSL